ncbi:MAG: hypothetical protein J6M02_03685 [Clostridia bacterium]|nr:hypothetical protein [Clostridia bacterium]
MEKDICQRADDLAKECERKNRITFTSFLTPTEQAEIEQEHYFNLYFYGGLESAERKRAFFLPDYIDKETYDFSSFISAFTSKFRFANLSHRDFLGAILNTGIKRECVGDIYVHEEDVYILVTKEIAPYLSVNLTKVGRSGIQLKEIHPSEVRSNEPVYQERSFTVSSSRLDSVAAGLFQISREDMAKKIKLGVVMLNYLPCIDSSKEVHEGDVVSVRGLGKAEIIEFGGTSRSGRVFVIGRRYR